jgi:hypothetical protein
MVDCREAVYDKEDGRRSQGWLVRVVYPRHFFSPLSFFSLSSVFDFSCLSTCED